MRKSLRKKVCLQGSQQPGDPCTAVVRPLLLLRAQIHVPIRAGIRLPAVGLVYPLVTVDRQLDCTARNAIPIRIFLEVNSFDEPEQIFTLWDIRWCIFSHTKAVDQRDVAEQGTT